MKKSKLWISSLLIALTASILVFAFPFSKILELKTRDFRAFLSRGNTVTAPVIIVAIDDLSFEKINIRWPWPRQILAEAIVRLKDAGARVIGLDIMMGDAGYSVEEDDALASALEYAENVVLPLKRDSRESGGQFIDYFDMPLSIFDKPAISHGYVNLLIDKDNYVRGVLPSDSSVGNVKYPFALSILSAYEDSEITGDQNQIHMGERIIPGARDKSFLINYADAGAFPVLPFYKLLEGDFDSQLFWDKMVLIGAFFQESHDRSLTPVEKTSGLYGIEIHANIINTVYSEKFLQDIPRSIEQFIILLLSCIGAFLFVRVKPATGLVITMVILFFYSLLSYFLYKASGIIIELFNPVFTVFLTWLGAILYNYLIVEKEKKYVRHTFSRFVSAEVVDSILDRNENIELGGELREVVIFFSDICGFTSMSEKMSPADVVEMLNEYFTRMSNIIFKYDGTLNKYIGDAIMAIYGAPVAMENASLKALKASLEMREDLKLFNDERIKGGKEPVNIG
ncbi:MAG: adenylate/guanylate cyclase domain-containing protein, partial [Spirochaetaceae bacterium]|nr:adenylate/guanylate cyclase domain-containing protein [Spirochaetaceae bacterium]